MIKKSGPGHFITIPAGCPAILGIGPDRDPIRTKKSGRVIPWIADIES